jgi:hypothetical protein
MRSRPVFDRGPISLRSVEKSNRREVKLAESATREAFMCGQMLLSHRPNWSVLWPHIFHALESASKLQASSALHMQCQIINLRPVNLILQYSDHLAGEDPSLPGYNKQSLTVSASRRSVHKLTIPSNPIVHHAYRTLFIMYRNLVLAASLLSVARGQLVGTQQTETHPGMTWQNCSAKGSCTTKNGRVVIDANWRWLHKKEGYICLPHG